MDASVIIPTYNAKERLSNCLSSLLKQDFKGFEVIVVNDGSTDGTLNVAKKFNVKVFSKLHHGPAIARNFGAQKAAGKILVFIDDDCIAAKNWLKEMIKPFSDEKVVGVQGAYKTKQENLAARFTQLEIEDRYDRLRKSKKMDWIGSYSAAYRRDVFLEQAGFDESFPTASGEDPALSFKMSKMGYKLVFNPKAVVYHEHDTSFFDYFKKKFFRAYWRVLLYKKHTEKIVADSYTPQTLKLQIVLFYLFLISAFFVFVFRQSMVFPILIISVGFTSTIPFMLKSLRRDFFISIISPFILGFRAVVFGLGLIAGILKGAWLK